MSDEENKTQGPGPIDPPWKSTVVPTDDRWTPFPMSYKENSALLKELVGRNLKVITPHSSTPLSLVSGEVVILVDENYTIQSVRVDDGLIKE